MFFPERIVSINERDKVLEVGPGGTPHPRADVLLDRRFGTEEESSAQRGYAGKLKTEKRTVYYNGGAFPFDDKEFDYVICSHVLEHVPRQDLDLFISELQRVAKRGYIEYPTIYYELINYEPVHLWLMGAREGEILFLDKEIFPTGPLHQIYRDMFYSNGYLSRIFEAYKDFFFVGFEWDSEIRYRAVSSFGELVTTEDARIWKNYFSNMPAPNATGGAGFGSLVSRIVTKLKRIAVRVLMRRNAKIAGTAILYKRQLIHLAEGAEVKDFVIIRTHEKPVMIGKHSQLNPFCVVYGGGGVVIGDNVMIGPHCMIAGGSHEYRQTAKPMRFAGDFSKGVIVIEDDVWVGANCTIMDGVKVSHGAVVGANSVVTKDVAPFDIVAGCPARRIGNRKEMFG